MKPLVIVFAAPHRLPFLVGTVNLLGLALWWLLHLAGPPLGPALLPTGTVPAGWLHGPAMLHLIFPPFVFGFLLTVFPRWMGYPDLQARSYGPVGVLLVLASLVSQAGVWTSREAILAAGLGLASVGWLVVVVVLARVALRSEADGKPRCWHAWSALPALVLGTTSCIMAGLAVGTIDAARLTAALQIGITGLCAVFLTVAHRMVPFFAGNVVAGYVRWRPDWLLALLWGLLLAGLIGQLLAVPALAAAGQGALAIVCLAMLWKWWPRGPAPGLLSVLFWALAWLPAGFALRAIAPAFPELGRAPDHAILIGFCASMLVAMVTRVTHGHSGRPLEMTWIAWLAFVGMQLTAVLRMCAALRFEQPELLVAAGAVFFVSLAPWCGSNIATYVRARRDGKDG